MNRKAIIVATCTAALAIAVALAACGGYREQRREALRSSRNRPGRRSRRARAKCRLAAADASGSAVPDENAPGLAPSDAATFDRKIIQDTSLDLQVEDVSKAYDDVETNRAHRRRLRPRLFSRPPTRTSRRRT